MQGHPAGAHEPVVIEQDDQVKRGSKWSVSRQLEQLHFDEDVDFARHLLRVGRRDVVHDALLITYDAHAKHVSGRVVVGGVECRSGCFAACMVGGDRNYRDFGGSGETRRFWRSIPSARGVHDRSDRAGGGGRRVWRKVGR